MNARTRTEARRAEQSSLYMVRHGKTVRSSQAVTRPTLRRRIDERKTACRYY